jgi:hypothetical protein
VRHCRLHVEGELFVLYRSTTFERKESTSMKNRVGYRPEEKIAGGDVSLDE